MLASMSVTEYREWQSHLSDRGFTVDLDNYRAAQICVTNLQPHLAEGAEIHLRDFYPNQSEPEPQTVEEMMAVMACNPGVIRE